MMMTFDTPDLDISRLRVRSSSPETSRPRQQVSQSMTHRRVYSLPSLSTLTSSRSTFTRRHTIAPLRSEPDSTPRLLPPVRLSPPSKPPRTFASLPLITPSRSSSPPTPPTPPRPLVRSVRFDLPIPSAPRSAPGQDRAKRVILVNAGLAAHLQNGGVVNIMGKQGKRWRVYLPMRR